MVTDGVLLWRVDEACRSLPISHTLTACRQSTLVSTRTFHVYHFSTIQCVTSCSLTASLPPSQWMHCYLVVECPTFTRTSISLTTKALFPSLPLFLPPSPCAPSLHFPPLLLLVLHTECALEVSYFFFTSHFPHPRLSGSGPLETSHGVWGAL